MKLVFEKGKGLETVCACCVYPPGDGSTCAGGMCECKEDYTCDKCKGKK